MKTKTKNIDTWLPVFSGFYDTMWNFDADRVLYDINETRAENNLKDIDCDVLDIDHGQYEHDIVKNIIGAVKDELSDYIENMDFQCIQSPKKYNFKNDSADVVIEPKIENIRKCIYDNIDDFKKYLKDHYTSCDGFISWFSNDFETWEQETSKFTDFAVSSHYLGSVLQFICTIEDITEYDIYEQVKNEMGEDGYINNYDKCINCLVCTKCAELIENDDIIKKAQQYKNLMNKNPSDIHCEDCMDHV